MDNAMKSVYDSVLARDPDQPEFHQAVEEVLDSLGPVIEANPGYIEVVRGMVEPERAVLFRVPWVDEGYFVRINEIAPCWANPAGRSLGNAKSPNGNPCF